MSSRSLQVCSTRAFFALLACTGLGSTAGRAAPHPHPRAEQDDAPVDYVAQARAEQDDAPVDYVAQARAEQDDAPVDHVAEARAEQDEAPVDHVAAARAEQDEAPIDHVAAARAEASVGNDPEARVPEKVAAPPPGPRPARRGFQMYIRTGVQFPFGEASDAPGDALTKRYSAQWALEVGLGAKVTDHLYIGPYLGFALGAEGGDAQIEAYCDDDDADLENDISCSSTSLRAGVEAIYSFHPDQDWNPWLGLGVGAEAAIQSLTDTERGRSESTTSTGYTWGKLSLGADFRRGVGIGPYAEFSLGRYNTTHTELEGSDYTAAIPDKALHYWLQLGVRLVILP